MTVFTVIGVLLFWVWCFQLGYGLGYVSHVAHLCLRMFFAERALRNEVAAFVYYIKVRP